MLLLLLLPLLLFVCAESATPPSTTVAFRGVGARRAPSRPSQTRESRCAAPPPRRGCSWRPRTPRAAFRAQGHRSVCCI